MVNQKYSVLIFFHFSNVTISLRKLSSYLSQIGQSQNTKKLAIYPKYFCEP